MRDQHDIGTELAAARELLDPTTLGHLAYTAPDGTPRVVPVGFWWTGRELVVSTAATAPKVAALTARPDVALAIDAGGTPERAVRRRSRARAAGAPRRRPAPGAPRAPRPRIRARRPPSW